MRLSITCNKHSGMDAGDKVDMRRKATNENNGNSKLYYAMDTEGKEEARTYEEYKSVTYCNIAGEETKGEETKGSETKTYYTTVLETDASKRCNIHGVCVLTTNNMGMVLSDPTKTKPAFHWSYTSIRKIGMLDSKVFYFESGRRCDSGEGRFVLMTKDAEFIHSTIMQYIKCIQKTSKKP